MVVPHVPLAIDVDAGADQARHQDSDGDRGPDGPPAPPHPVAGARSLLSESRDGGGRVVRPLVGRGLRPARDYAGVHGRPRPCGFVGDEVDDDRRDVVVATGAVRRVDEPIAGGLGFGLSLQDLLDTLAAHHAGEPVGAQEYAIPFLDVQRELIQGHLFFDPEDSSEDAPLGVMGGLLLGELSLAHHPLDERVILGELLQRAVAKPVRAGVADMDYVGLPVRGQQRGDRRAHTPEVLVGLAPLGDALVGLLDLFEVLVLRLRGGCLDRLQGHR